MNRLPAFVRLLLTPPKALWRWHREQSSIRALDKIPSFLLRDIGISRADLPMVVKGLLDNSEVATRDATPECRSPERSESTVTTIRRKDYPGGGCEKLDRAA